MSEDRSAVDWAAARVAAVRDDPAARLALITETYHGPVGRAPRHLPFRRAALSFMRWQADRGMLNTPDRAPTRNRGGREANGRPLRDGTHAGALVGGVALD